MALILPKRKASGVDVADVFSTDLWSGNSSTQTITNGIDLSGEGGLVWIKSRSASYDHYLIDSARGITKKLSSNLTAIEAAQSDISSFNSDGYSLNHYWGGQNFSGQTFAGWTFRKSPKFFDIVTYTGDGVAGREIAHDLGQDVGMIIIKSTTVNGSNWIVYHRKQNTTPQNYYLQLEATNAAATGSGFWNNTAPTDSHFTLGSWSYVNHSGASFVAYIFAHDDSDNGVIQCGSYTGNGSTTGPVIDLGWEPQYLMIKNTNGPFPEYWVVMDNARSPANTRDDLLFPNLTSAESSGFRGFDFLSTGFQPVTTSSEMNLSGKNYVYMAIRKEGV
jgi:hypothetical protein